MSQVDVFSPNHEEAAGFLSVPKSQISGKSVRRAIETLLFDKFASSLKGIKVPVICIRSGALGSLVSQSTDKAVWVEAYHSAEQAGRVIDVTGAGNAWLGGFTAGLAKLHRNGGERKGWTDEELKLAAQMASVSASFVVEQQGLPSLRIDREARVEKWNGEKPASRLALLQSRAKT
jgi:sugar/nucleoside kinase (ribokinase family)